MPRASLKAKDAIGGFGFQVGVPYEVTEAVATVFKGQKQESKPFFCVQITGKQVTPDGLDENEVHEQFSIWASPKGGALAPGNAKSDTDDDPAKLTEGDTSNEFSDDDVETKGNVIWTDGTTGLSARSGWTRFSESLEKAGLPEQTLAGRLSGLVGMQFIPKKIQEKYTPQGGAEKTTSVTLCDRIVKMPGKGKAGKVQAQAQATAPATAPADSDVDAESMAVELLTEFASEKSGQSLGVGIYKAGIQQRIMKATKDAGVRDAMKELLTDMDWVANTGLASGDGKKVTFESV